jgi:antitoxin (DNA-binding transcriptional repressor) of toxin-antitoxin stability system
MNKSKLKSKKQTKMQPNVVGLRELRESMDSYVNRVSNGESFLVLRKSRPVFKMEPVDEWGDEGSWDMLDLRDKNGNGMNIHEFAAMIKKSITDDEQKSKVSKKNKQKRESSSIPGN